jgi:hypothetical protein
MQTTEPARGDRAALLWLAALLLFVLAAALVVPWSGVWNVDNRTYAEMTDGVVRHGLPYTTNGDFERFREARAPFEQPAHGKLWGEYPPLFAYVAAPALALGGMPWVYKLNVVLIGAIAVATFALGRRVWGDARVGAAAATVVVLSSPVWSASIETFAQPLVGLLVTLATWAAVGVVDAAELRARRLAVAAGIMGGAAVAAHLLAFPMMLVLVAGLALVPGPVGRRSMTRAALALGGLCAPLLPMAALNAYRFGSPNPVSYGPCVWDNCKMNLGSEVTAAAMIGWAGPGLAWIAATAAALFLARRSRRALLLTAGVAIAVLLPPWIVRDRTLALARTLYGYAIDMSNLDVLVRDKDFTWFGPAPDGLGNLHVGPDGRLESGTALKALLQCAPVLGLAPLVRFARTGPPARALLCVLPALGLAAGLSLNARFPGGAALGWPYLFPRYTAPAVPMLAVLAVGAARALPWKRWHAAVAVAVAIAGLVYFLPRQDDAPWLRRLLELRGTLLLSAAAIGAVVVARRRKAFGGAASLTVAAAVGAGVAVSLGVDARILAGDMNHIERRVRRFAVVAPERFALAGWGPDTDPILALRASRDVEYLDLTESRDDWRNFREAMDVWARDGRPIFGVFPTGGRFAWPYADWDVPAEQVDEENGFWRIGPPRVPAPPR